MPRASVCGCVSASPSEWTGPAGTPAASSRAIHSARVARAEHGVHSAVSASRCAMRAVLVANRGSSRHSG